MTVDRRIKPIPFATDGPLYWYFVGLIATDGCLSSDGQHIDITAKERGYLLRVRQALRLRPKVFMKRGGNGQAAYRIHIGSTLLYKKLVETGLTPRKSLTLGPLHIPDRHFHDFLRGVIDGDGNIRRWIHPTNGREQWAVRIYSAAPRFVQWLQETIKRLWRVEGALMKEDREPHSPGYVLKYGKLAVKAILRRCYYSGALALARKQSLADKCISVHVGWSQSKTVADTEECQLWDYVRQPCD